jgi:hypothetical protein
VRSLTDEEHEKAARQNELEKRYTRNKDVIDEIKRVLREGKPMNKTELIHTVMQTGFSRRRIDQTLKDHSGRNVAAFQFWHVEDGEKNATFYTLHDRD